MWKLTIQDDEGQRATLQLTAAEYTVGRAEGSTLRLSDRNVSRKHAVLRRLVQGYSVVDQESDNGVWLLRAAQDGQVEVQRVVREAGLRSGDVLQIGDYRLLVEEQRAPLPAPQADPALDSSAVMAAMKPARLVVVDGPKPGAEYLLGAPRYSVGRAESSSILINHASISRVHAELIAVAADRYEVLDRESANGVRINGVELRRGFIEAGDSLEIGDVRLRFVGAGQVFRTAHRLQDLQVGALPPRTIAAVSPSASRRPALIAVGLASLLTVVALWGLVRAWNSAASAPARTQTASPGVKAAGMRAARSGSP